MELIAQVIETLQPWLNPELYAEMKDHTENTRENINWGRPEEPDDMEEL